MYKLYIWNLNDRRLLFCVIGASTLNVLITIIIGKKNNNFKRNRLIILAIPTKAIISNITFTIAECNIAHYTLQCILYNALLSSCKHGISACSCSVAHRSDWCKTDTIWRVENRTRPLITCNVRAYLYNIRTIPHLYIILLCVCLLCRRYDRQTSVTRKDDYMEYT
jgi:hypothetical protein